MKIFDFHVHCYPDKLAERALANSRKVPGVTVHSDGTLSALEASMAQSGIDAFLNLPLVMTPDSNRGVNNFAAKLDSRKNCHSLGSIHPATAKVDDHLKWVAEELGLKGIKMHPEYQKFSFDDAALFPIWEACIKYDLFLLTHTGRDISFPPVPRSNPESLLKFHRRFPELTLVLAHFGSWSMWDEADILLGENFYLDTSYTAPCLSADKILAKIRKHGADKILFGTDSPWGDQAFEVNFYQNLGLTESELEKIFYSNAAKLLQLDS